MDKKALIVYSTWSGSTREIAEYIGNTLKKADIDVNILSAKENVELEKYNTVVIGTSIHAGRTISSFRKFLKKNVKMLSTKKIAYFVSCANMMNDTEETRSETMGWLQNAIKAYPEITPVSTGLFGGATITSGDSFNKLNIFVRRIIEIMKKNMIAEYGKSDFRDWQQIGLWAEELARIL